MTLLANGDSEEDILHRSSGHLVMCVISNTEVNYEIQKNHAFHDGLQSLTLRGAILDGIETVHMIRKALVSKDNVPA
jgi:hypothetical protein